jgi:hypothetical protein
VEVKITNKFLISLVSGTSKAKELEEIQQEIEIKISEK